MANFSEAFAEAINSIADELERLGTDGEKKLKRMISFLQLQGKLNPQEGEEISGFSELVERLWQHECIHAGDVSLLEKTLKTVGLEECARRLSNCPSVCAELNTKNIYDIDEKARLLRSQLKTAYVAITNMHLPSAPSNTWDVDELFCDVQLYLNKRPTSTGLKEPLSSYCKLFEFEDKTRFMLKGKTASGKTTLLRKITKDWVGDHLKKFELLITLWMGELKPDWTLGDAVVNRLLPNDCGISSEEVDAIIRKKKDKVAILIDACQVSKLTVPEAEDAQNSDSPLLLRDILTYRQLRESFVLVATRLHDAKEICSQSGKLYSAYQHVEMAGFEEDTMKAFVSKAVSDEEKQQSLIRYLETNHLKAMARTPGLLHMLCAYWNADQNLPDNHDSLTSVLYKVVFGLYEHSRGLRNCASVPPDANHDLMESECKFLSSMKSIGKTGKTALKTLTNGVEVLKMKELKDGNNDKTIELFCKIGLFKTEDHFRLQHQFRCISNKERQPFDIQDDSQDDEVEGVTDPETESTPFSPNDHLVSFHSNHIHCYCAGLYLRDLARNSFDKFKKRLKMLLKLDRLFESRYIYVFMFCFSIVGTDIFEEKELNVKIGRVMLKSMAEVVEHAVDKLRRDPNPNTEMKVSNVRDHFVKLCLHCNYEAQVESQLNKEMRECIKEGTLTLVGLSEYTTRALSYFLKHSMPRTSLSSKAPDTKFQLTALKIISHGSEVNITSLKEFTKNVPGGMDFFRSLMSENMMLEPKELQNLLNSRKVEFSKVKYLEDLCDVKKVSLLDFFVHVSKWNPYTNFILPSIEALIQYQHMNLKELSLIGQNEKSEVWTKLFAAFRDRKFTSLEVLDLSLCELSEKQQRLLCPCFVPSKKMLPNLREVALSGVKCSNRFVLSLKHLSLLERLELQDCGLTENVMSILIESIQSMKNLKKLDLRRNDFSGENAQDFEKVLASLTLEVLKLGLNKVDKNIPRLLSAIRKQVTLKVLHLNHCPVPIALIRNCKDLPVALRNLEDFRLSASLPSYKSGESPVLPKIKLLEETINSFSTQIKTLKKLQNFALLYCELDVTNFFKLYRACQYLKTHHCLELMRYSYAALNSQSGKNREIKRFLSDGGDGIYLQLW